MERQSARDIFSLRVLVVIVNYRTADLTVGAIRALCGEMGELPNLRISVVDNASGDGSQEIIEGELKRLNWGERAGFIQVGRNSGFAAGNNAAIRPALASANPPDYVFLLNPDTLAEAGAIRILLEFMERHPDVGLTGSRMKYPDGSSQPSSFRFHSVLSEFESSVRLGIISLILWRQRVPITLPDKPIQVDWVGGAAMMIRREVFEEIGLLDEGYFIYYEETDFCLRARRAGWTSWFVPQSVVVHLEGQSTGVSDPKRAPKRRPEYWFASRRRYFVKNYGPLTATAADVAWTLGFATFRVRQFIQRKPQTDPPHFLRDFVRYNFASRGRRSP
jgi:N-acetylglucosaminyl-diphospho-decaprenol L-rhamnosyltransferase